MKRGFQLKLLLLAAVGSAALACSAPAATPTFGVKFDVVSDNGDVLPGAAVRVHGHQIGLTNERGELDAELDGADGEVVPIDIQCGTGYRSPDHALPLKLTRTRRIASGPSVSRIPYDAVCTRRQRSVVVVARAEKQPGIPIIVEGRQVAVTDAEGNAHALVPLDADVAVLHVAFDTSSRSELIPKNPGRASEVGQGDDIVTIEQKFSVALKPVIPKLSPPQPKRVPIRID